MLYKTCVTIHVQSFNCMILSCIYSATPRHSTNALATSITTKTVQYLPPLASSPTIYASRGTVPDRTLQIPGISIFPQNPVIRPPPSIFFPNFYIRFLPPHLIYHPTNPLPPHLHPHSHLSVPINYPHSHPLSISPALHLTRSPSHPSLHPSHFPSLPIRIHALLLPARPARRASPPHRRPWPSSPRSRASPSPPRPRSPHLSVPHAHLRRVRRARLPRLSSVTSWMISWLRLSIVNTFH